MQMCRLHFCLTLLLNVEVDAFLSSLCCGDNFCCAIVASSSSATCWGGNSMGSKVPSTAVKALTCGGKAVMGIDSDMKVSFYVGSEGYGPDHSDASGLIGVEVKDADLSFWGGAVLKSDGTIQAWGPDTVYCSSATSISCQPTATQPTSVNFAFTNVPSGTTSFTGLACAGKRGGHWCCAFESGVQGLTCFGDNRGEYTPTNSQIASIDFPVHQISGGVDFVAVLGTSGQLGVYGGTGEIGNGLTNTKPTDIGDLSMGSVVANQVYVQVSTMNFAVYALKADGTLHAWGKSYSYSVGGGGSVDMAVYPDGVSWSQLAGGAGIYAHFCALQSDSKPNCWGADYSGQVSDRTTSVVSTAYMHPALLGSSSPSPTPTPSPTSSPTPSPSSSPTPSPSSSPTPSPSPSPSASEAPSPTPAPSPSPSAASTSKANHASDVVFKTGVMMLGLWIVAEC
eukprot:TRINITY_DN4350_c0_g1_i2.p1 TRINITY_DN4350_c0_g1~~TRINITY_DN4350_c0_g1_i2.p1  ORF type:complete len:452 (+),score=51.70 TRINITY_DN4350_c0_g1_i2:67-1422(+)